MTGRTGKTYPPPSELPSELVVMSDSANIVVNHLAVSQQASD